MSPPPDVVDLTVAGRGTSPGAVRLVGTLALAGMLAGLALAGAYELTRPTIEANRRARRERAVLLVVPGATTMRALALEDGHLVAATPGAEGDGVFAAYDDAGGFLGYAIEGAAPGYQDTIRVLFGYAPDRRRITGMEVLQSRETPGLGDGIYKDAEFVAQFGALAVDPPIAVVKDGATADHEIDAITGATISSRAVGRILNEGVERWRALLPAPDEAPPAPLAPPTPVEAGDAIAPREEG